MASCGLPQKGSSLRITDGLEGFAGGIVFVLTSPRVWGYALVPAAIAMGLFAGLSFLGFWVAEQASHALLGTPMGTWGRLGNWVIIVTLTLIGLVMAVLVSLCLAQPLSGFALDAIVYAQERAQTGSSSPPPGRLESLLRTTKVAVVTLLVGVPIFSFFFLIDWLFPPAVVITIPLKFLTGAWLLAWNFLDYPLGIRRFGIRMRLKWVFRHFEAFTVFGMLWAAFVIVPGVILVLLPMGVAGATRLVLEEETRAR